MKDLVYIHLRLRCVLEILRFALDDNALEKLKKNSVELSVLCGELNIIRMV